MNRPQRLARALFAIAMGCLGVLALVYSRVGETWYSIPDWVPWGGGVTIISGVVLLCGGIGLVFERSRRSAALSLLVYLTLWLLLRGPEVVKEPLTAVLWENAAEIGALVAGAWIIRGGTGGLRGAGILYGLALVAFGVSHFAYLPQTAHLVPGWLPWPDGWAYLTGAAHAAAGLGILCSVLPGLAARLEAAMLSLFTVVVWVPAIFATPTSLPIWTEIVVSLGVTAAAWVVAASLTGSDAPQ